MWHQTGVYPSGRYTSRMTTSVYFRPSHTVFASTHTHTQTHTRTLLKPMQGRLKPGRAEGAHSPPPNPRQVTAKVHKPYPEPLIPAPPAPQVPEQVAHLPHPLSSEAAK